VGFGQDAAKGIDPTKSLYSSAGINYVFPVIQALAIAGQLPGGLTRTSFQLALRSTDMTSPILLPGLHLHMDRAKDAYIVEGGQIVRWDASKQTYIPPGQRPRPRWHNQPCSWDQSISSCK
jgi:hypothetical protein